jgi:hypothetical protein
VGLQLKQAIVGIGVVTETRDYGLCGFNKKLIILPLKEQRALANYNSIV